MDTFIGAIAFFWILLLISCGIVQPLASVIRLITARRWSSAYAIGLRRYIAVVIIYVATWITLDMGPFCDSNFFSFFYMHVLPAVIAVGYYRHVRRWDSIHRNVEAYDQMKALDEPHPDRLELMTLPTKKIKIGGIKRKLKVMELA